ncbi:ribonuclease H protein [Tanacetum coccineum]
MATNGSHPSWLWKSLLLGRDLLLRGVRWQVGPFSPNVLVYDFINNGEWDVSKLNDAVLPKEALLETVHSKSERMKLHTSLANIAWQIWKSQNGKVFNACQLCPPHTISSVNSMVSDFNSLFSTSYPTSSALVYHDVPQESSLRVALGVIARDSTAISQGWQNATIESDSKLAVSFASSEADPPWAVDAIVDDIKLWASQLALSFLWVNRNCNLAAHHVAKVAFSSHVNFVWDVTFPVEITSIARRDI